MIKFTAWPKKDKLLIGFGLSEKNIELLKEGYPISIKLSDLKIGLNGEIVIFYGKTEAIMAKELAEQFDMTGTKIHSHLEEDHQ